MRLAIDRSSCRVASLLILWPPEVFLSMRSALDPRRQNSAWQLVRPGVFEVLVGGFNAAARSFLDDPDGGVDEDVRDDAGNEAVGDAVSEGHHGDGQEGWDGVAHVRPVDFGGGFNHHGADDDESAAGGPRRDGGEDGREEDGDEEAEAGCDCGKAGGAAFGNASAGFDEGGDGRAAEERADGDAEGIDEVGDGGALEVLSFFVDGASEASHGVHSTSAVKDVNVEEPAMCVSGEPHSGASVATYVMNAKPNWPPYDPTFHSWTFRVF
jgi:hypothetical protein